MDSLRKILFVFVAVSFVSLPFSASAGISDDPDPTGYSDISSGNGFPEAPNRTHGIIDEPDPTGIADIAENRPADPVGTNGIFDDPDPVGFTLRHKN